MLFGGIDLGRARPSQTQLVLGMSLEWHLNYPLAWNTQLEASLGMWSSGVGPINRWLWNCLGKDICHQGKEQQPGHGLTHGWARCWQDLPWWQVQNSCFCDPSHSTSFPAPSVTESPESKSGCLSLVTTEKGKFSLRNIKRTKLLKIFLLNGIQVNFDSFKSLTSFDPTWRSNSLTSPYLGGVETSLTPLFMLFSEEKQCHTKFLSDGCLLFLTCLVKGLLYLSQQQLQMLIDWDCSYSLDLAGLNLAQTFRYSAEPSYFYFSGDSQLHDIIWICSQQDNRWLGSL